MRHNGMKRHPRHHIDPMTNIPRCFCRDQMVIDRLTVTAYIISINTVQVQDEHMNPLLTFCVFSFNRGEYLKNCIRSIERCAPESKIIIFDDDSDDPETIAVLREIKRRYTVVQTGHSNTTHHLGGLYSNMQKALAFSRDEKLICFLQDDTQIVRTVSAKDIETINNIFERDPKLGFLHPCFIRGINLERRVTFSYDESLGIYFRDPTTRSVGRFFSALLITRPARLMAAGWRFGPSEPANNHLAEKLFSPMGYLFAPFAMWLPEVPAYRGKKKTFALRRAEKIRHCGFYPFNILSENEVEGLMSRDASVLPVAEAFLSCRGSEPAKPWTYNPLTRLKGLKMLNELEVGLRRMRIKLSGQLKRQG